MSSLSLNDHVDHQRWLMERGLLNDLHKNNLYVYGALVHQSVEAVELRIDIERKLLTYEIFFATKMMRVIELYNRLKSNKSIISLWRTRRLLKKYGSLEFEVLLARFIKDYCGPLWRIEVAIKDIGQYCDGIGQDTDADIVKGDRAPN